MRYQKIIMMLGGCAAMVAIACSDSGVAQPDATRAALGTSGNTSGTDTAKSNPGTTNPGATKPDSGKTTSPVPTPDTGKTTLSDTTGQAPSTPAAQHAIRGIVMGLGAAPDTTNGQLLGGASVVLSLPADPLTATPGTEVMRATTGANGSFSLGSVLPGRYVVTVTPPAGAPYKALQLSVIFYTTSPATVSLTLYLQRQ